MRAFPHRTGLLDCTVVRNRSSLRRRMSVKGAIKKTRSIAVERKNLEFFVTKLKTCQMCLMINLPVVKITTEFKYH